jgi:hypothetical protein
MQIVRYLVVVGIVSGAMAPTRSEATDTLIPGAKIKIADATQAGVARRRIIFVSKDPAIPLPGDGSAGDPSLNGGSLRVVNTAGSGESQVFALGAGNGADLAIEQSAAAGSTKAYRSPASTQDQVVLKQTYSGVVRGPSSTTTAAA